MMAKQRIEPRIACFGDDLAVTVGIEFVDHHPVIAGEVAEGLRHRVGQDADIRGGTEALQRARQAIEHHLVADVERIGHAIAPGDRLEFQDQFTARVPVETAFQLKAAAGAVDMAMQGHHFRQRIGRRYLPHPRIDVAPQCFQRAIEQAGDGNAQDEGRVCAGLHYLHVGSAQHQQHAVRLHRPGEMNQFTLAIAEVRLAE